MTMIDDLAAFIGSLGSSDETDTAFGIDFNNSIIGSPYIEGTGWLPDYDTAKGVASLVLPIVNAVAVAELAGNPDRRYARTHPEEDAESSWATIVSAKRVRDEPVTEEYFEGDVWFAVSVDMNLLSAEQQALLDKIRPILEVDSAR